jgi:putative endonuclease
MAVHNDFGKTGETLARAYLENKGYTLLHLNWRWQKAEVDIIAVQEGLLVFVEVKTRQTAYFGNPHEAVTPAKEALLREAAEAYIARYELDNEIRFDSVSIVTLPGQAPSIEHIEQAF